MDISLNKRRTCLKTAIHVHETHLGGRVSQNFDIGLSLNLTASRKGDFEKSAKKSQKLPVFCSKIKTKTNFKSLRHPSLDEHVSYTYRKVGMCRPYIK